MKKPDITLIPTEGLGNRLRTIASVYTFAKNNGYSLEILWQREICLNARFDTLFESPADLKIRDANIINFFTHNKPYRYNLRLPLLFDKIFKRNTAYYLDKFRLKEFTHKFPITVLSLEVQDEIWPLSQLFIPKADIRKIIYDVIGRDPIEGSANHDNDGHLIGCHIRRTDNVQSTNISSLDKFESRFAELSKDTRNKVFLATDDNEIKDYLKNKYGSLIITYDSTLSRKSAKGIRDAVVEMWCLALCDVILGSYWSSFTDMASLIYHKPLIVVS